MEKKFKRKRKGYLGRYLISSATSWRSVSVLVLRPCRFLPPLKTGDLGPRQRTDPPVFLVDGVRVEKDPWQDKSVPSHALRWCETLFYQQLTQQTTYQANII
ncbi:hypothetical protein ACN38_g6810 [Penicillium nordicum]|uniref:Uncharacterized protein n=1 Tax=Penicillium nordicum TaxID=229535 RepID=A0A0M9WEZ4_9EURO|nr:hypothetical protein ACN38_g6810 [Penicillium nordicum]